MTDGLVPFRNSQLPHNCPVNQAVGRQGAVAECPGALHVGELTAGLLNNWA